MGRWPQQCWSDHTWTGMHLQALLRLPPTLRLWQEVVHVWPSVKTIKTKHDELVRGKDLSDPHGSKTTVDNRLVGISTSRLVLMPLNMSTSSTMLALQGWPFVRTTSTDGWASTDRTVSTLIYATYFLPLWSWLAIGIGLLCIYSRSRHRKMTLALFLSLPHWGAGISNLLPETYLIIFCIPPTAQYILPNAHCKLCSVHWKIPIAHYTLHTTWCRRHTPDCTL